MNHVVIATWQAKPGQAELVAKLLSQLRAASLAENGVQVYECCVQISDPNKFVVFESFSDREAFTAHVTSQHFGELMPQLTDVVEPPQAEFYSTVL
jgi:quinol monooxygenase YgiN